MVRTMFSQNWFRVASLRPRLRSHAKIHRHIYRRSPWYVIQDDQTGRYHRLSASANHMVALMDGRRSVGEIWTLTTRWLGDDAEPPTQDEVIRLLAQLHHADLLAGDLPPDIEELAHRSETRSRKTLIARLKNPLALRLPLIDPDRFLTLTMPLIRPAFSLFGLLVWLSVVIAGATIAVLNWEPLTVGLVDRVFLAENILLLLLVYPLIKAVHELGHGYAVKNWGGEVHEVGFMFLVLIPVPYIDASASSAFGSKWRRAVVAGAGVMVELFIAGLAVIIWVTVESGVIRAAAFNAALIGGVSTLLFNGNPLLRFDGYYVLTDILEIPNFGTRANRYFFYVCKRYLFGLRNEQSPATSKGERKWFFFYAVAAFLYRIAIVTGIALFVAGKLFFIGVALAIMALVNAFVIPFGKGVWWLLTAPELRGKRKRALTLSGASLGLCAALFLAVPFPYATSAQGVVWVPEEAVVRVDVEGFVLEVSGANAAGVSKGQTLLRLSDVDLSAQRDLLRAEKAEIQLRLAAEVVSDRVREAVLREQLAHSQAALDRIEERMRGLTVVASRSGRFLVPKAADLPGRFLKQGHLIGYLVAPDDPTIHAIVPQSTADLVRRRLIKVDVVLADTIGSSSPSKIVRSVPKAGKQLPSAALGTEGGGTIVLDPTVRDGVTALDPHFEFELELELPDSFKNLPVGQRVYVRFDHGSEPVAFRLARSLRQLFLSQFDV